MTVVLEKEVPHPSWIEVDLNQFKKNIQSVRHRIGEKIFCLCVKGDAYGHGLCEMSRVAQDEGVDRLAVACLKEGVALRAFGITIPILVLGAIHEDQIDALIQNDLEITLSSRYKAELVLSACSRLRKKCRVHLEVDTGMNRTGVRVESAFKLIPWIASQKLFQFVGVYSHLGSSDRENDLFTHVQIRKFRSLQEHFRGSSLIWHLANSGGVLFYPESLFDMVRPGILCYGYFPDGSEDPLGEIAPCFSLKSKVSYFKVVEEGSAIGYGQNYKTARRSRVVTVPIGYADGYPRALSNKGSVLIRGCEYKISGIICMDQFMVDVGSSDVYVGDQVTLIGKQGNRQIRLNEVASRAGIIPHELLCSLKGRQSRIYTKEDV